MQKIRLAPIISALVIGAALQVLFIFPDIKDTPNKAVIEFATAYFKVDKSMGNRLCDERKTVNGTDVVEEYIQIKTKEARDRGLSMFYLKDKLYNIRTKSAKRDKSSVEIRLTAEVKPPLKSFFTNEDYRQIDEIIKVINDNGKWKVCGRLFSLPGN
ncbi:MAG: hypothetical protein JRF40_01970 [Deltaproteobacteria bacterium]|nr:hypothetical protein [Deltaproteobacteria bacterium]